LEIVALNLDSQGTLILERSRAVKGNRMASISGTDRALALGAVHPRTSAIIVLLSRDSRINIRSLIYVVWRGRFEISVAMGVGHAAFCSQRNASCLNAQASNQPAKNVFIDTLSWELARTWKGGEPTPLREEDTSTVIDLRQITKLVDPMFIDCLWTRLINWKTSPCAS